MKRYIFAFLVLSINFYFSQKNKNLDCYDLKKVLEVEATALYQPHLDASKKFNIKLLKDSKDITKYNNKGKLPKIKLNGTGYKVQKLDYSHPYLVSKAKTTLEKIGSKFSKDNKGSKITITSVTRSLEDQCRLRKVNKNASLGISSHNYGNSFDISYVRFNGKLEQNSKLDAALLKVLKHFEGLGRIYYIKEKQQSCYHVTVRNY
ncbi:DUF5715 family protein [Soonwooa sp.]|uniref:DUF5715 family protein n=1 Tax=Soonwooa sp. TaxID=1938592 RepID=UPI00260BD3B1|nr:DUF5715 family protein [Soonwooa sp.]